MDSSIPGSLIVAGVCLAGCAGQGEYAELPYEMARDATLSCEGLDQEIARVDQVRDDIMKEHGDAIYDAVADTATDAVVSPVRGAVSGVINSISAGKETRSAARAAASAGDRLEHLLRLKRTNDCPTGITKEWGVSDEQLLARIEAARAEYEAGEISINTYLRRRAEILDKVRY